MFKKIGITSLVTLGLLSNTSFAESYKDKAPEILPNVSNHKEVLVDNTHGQTAGAADWVIDGGFSDFAQGMANQGYTVKELRKNTAITYEDIKDYEIFVIPEANIPFKASEQAAILKYVQKGGSVFFIADHYNADRNLNRFDSSEVFNGYRRGAFLDSTKDMSPEEKASEKMQGVTGSDWLSAHFGVRFRYNALGDLTANNIVKGKDGLGITEGVNSVAMHAGSTIAITKPNIAKGLVYLPEGLTAADKWKPAVDQGVYFGGGKKEGAYVAVSKVGLGKAAFIGDSSLVEDSTPKYLREDSGKPKKTYDGYKEQDDKKLLENLVDWLGTKESYKSFKGKVTLDEKSPLLQFEKPEVSTEPQKEPWATPSQSYKWYDTSTFKPGSYGYEGKVIVTPTNDQYDFEVGDIQNGTAFKTILKIKGLQPNTTLSGFKVGIYQTGGNQIGSFLINGTWNPVGYSSDFEIKTDNEGNAVVEIESKTTAGITGEAFIRLKQGTKTLYTENISIK